MQSILDRITDGIVGGNASLQFAVVAFFALGIERVLYGYCFIFTEHFKCTVDANRCPGLNDITKESTDYYYSKCMQRLGMYVKVFQFGVCIYDLLVLDIDNVSSNLWGGWAMFSTTEKLAQFAAGLSLLAVGQVLNVAVFQALGYQGVYYGYEFGYPVARVSCFPYNLNINDPQYWGVVLSVLGIYVAVGASSYMVPLMELFWYGVSMRILEAERGRRWFGGGAAVKKSA